MKELALEYYGQGFNCSQSILKAADVCYSLNLNQQLFDMCSPISKGFGIGSFCGALIAGFLVFGLMFDENTAKKMRMQLLAGFESEYSCFDCAVLIRGHKQDNMCKGLIASIAEMIHIIIENELN